MTREKRKVKVAAGLNLRQIVVALLIYKGLLLIGVNVKNGKWGFPGGGIELHETKRETLHKEVLEEIGTHIADLIGSEMFEVAIEEFLKENFVKDSERFDGELIYYMGAHLISRPPLLNGKQFTNLRLVTRKEAHMLLATRLSKTTGRSDKKSVVLRDIVDKLFERGKIH